MISPLIISSLDNSNLKIMLNGALLQLINIPNLGFQFFKFGINAIEGRNILTFQKITS
jgi:hypothetical protein